MFNPVFVMVAAMAAFIGVHLAICHPLLVACDRSVARRRMGMASHVSMSSKSVDHQMAADVLQSVASRMRTGVSIAEAFGDECVNAHVHPDALNAVIGAHTSRITSPAELDLRAAHHRSLHLMKSDVRVHTAQARASAKVLTVAPVAFLTILMTGSPSLRSRLMNSPALIAAVVLGLVVNHGARSWMSRLIDGASRIDDHDEAITDIHSQVSVALTAGHTITDALVIAHSECGARAREMLEQTVQRLTTGGSLADSLTLLGSDARLRPLTRVLTDSQRHGTPVTQIAEQLTSVAHHLRRSIIDERIRRLPVRLAAPLIVGVLPAFILLAVMPLIAASMGSFDFAPQEM